MKPQSTKQGRDARACGRQQWLLLVLAGAFIATNALALSLNGGTEQSDWTGLIVWIICALAGGIILDRYLPDRDPILFPVVMLLSGWGLLTLTRLAPSFANRQEIWILIATVAMLLVAVFPQALRWLRSYRYVILAVALGLMLATIVFGSNPSGFAYAPRLWLRFGAIYLQPSEMMKVVLVAFLASYFGESAAAFSIAEEDSGPRVHLPRLLGPTLLISAISLVMLIWQRDLGTAMLFFAVFVLCAVFDKWQLAGHRGWYSDSARCGIRRLPLV